MIRKERHYHRDGHGVATDWIDLDIDTTGDVRETHAQRHQQSSWRTIREAFFETPEGVPYAYHDGRRTHHVSTITQLAAVTRRERMLWGVEWREDAKVV